MPFFEKGDIRISYEEAGSGFPLLLVPGGGLNSRISNWPNAVFNSMEIFKDEFHCITMDQRNPNGIVPAFDEAEAGHFGFRLGREPAGADGSRKERAG